MIRSFFINFRPDVILYLIFLEQRLFIVLENIIITTVRYLN